MGGELGGGEQLCQDPLPNGYTRDKMRICQTNYFFDDAIRFFKSNSDWACADRNQVNYPKIISSH